MSEKVFFLLKNNFLLSHQGSTNHNDSEITIYVRMAMIKPTSNSHAGKDVEKEEQPFIANMYKYFVNPWWVPRKLGIDLPQDLDITLMGLYSKDAPCYH